MVSPTTSDVPKRPSFGHWRAESAGGDPAPRLRRASRGRARRPRVLLVNQYYWPDHASTAQHLTDLAESLAAAGFDCHVVCSQGGYKPGQGSAKRQEVRHGVQIHRIPATSLGRKSTLRRMADYLSFYAGAALRCLTLPRFDVSITLTTPPMIALVGTMLRALRGTQHVYWSMDLHPDASLALGRMSRHHPVVDLLARLSDFIYRRADRVVALGPYMADRLQAKGVRQARLVQIPVWSRRDEIYPLPRQGHPLREELGLSDKFVAMYSGNLGLAHTSEEFLEAARRLRDRPDIVFLFVGGGPRSKEVREAKDREQLDNVRLLDYFPREQLHASLSVADVHLVSMRREMTGIVVPGKLYGAMASARPVLFVGPEHSETADAIQEAECGRTIRLGDADGLVSAILELADDPELASSMGARAREAFLESYDRQICCESWVNLLEDLVGELAPATPRRRVAVRPQPTRAGA